MPNTKMLERLKSLPSARLSELIYSFDGDDVIPPGPTIERAIGLIKLVESRGSDSWSRLESLVQWTDGRPELDLGWEALDQLLLQRYFSECKHYDEDFAPHARGDQASIETFLLNRDLAQRSGGDVPLVLRDDGVLLFATRMQIPIHRLHTHVQIAWRVSRVRTEELWGSIMHLRDEILVRLEPLSSRVVGDPKIRRSTGGEAKISEYPRVAIVEAVTNLLIHRDYREDDQASIHVHADRLEFINPGISRVLPEVLLTNTEFLRPKYPRNPRIIEATNLARLNQRLGSGILRIRQALDENGTVGAEGGTGIQIWNDTEKNRFHLVLFRRDLSSLLQPARSTLEVDTQPTEARSQTGHDLSRIQRYTPADLIGRDDELAGLDEAWDKVRRAETPRPHVLTYVALGGEGKTSLIAHWAAQLASHGWPGCDAAFAWSFYSQGTRDQGDASADVFLAEALRFFGDKGMADSAASAWDKGRRLAQLVGERRTLLILDGLEPLQYAPTSPTRGELKEVGIIALLSGLAENSAGLCIVTTRYSIPDLNTYRQTTAPQIELKRLSTKAGVRLLQRLGVRKESGTQEQFETLVEDVKGHALTLNLLGKYLADAHAGDIRKRDLVKLEEADAEEQGGHAFRVMDADVDWFEREGEKGRQAIGLLRLMGLFDRAASADSIAALSETPVIEKLTEALVGLNEAEQNLALTRLEAARLISIERDEMGTLLALDCHPLIREYFARRLQDERPEAWWAGHKRLYEHLCNTTKEGDEPTLEQLKPLYQAVTHGCLAGLQREAFDEVFVARVLKGTGPGRSYSAFKLGAFGADLGAIACFFDEPWTRVSSALSEDDRAWLLNQAAFRLRGLGRLREALEPMRVSGEMNVSAKNWHGAASSHSNLSELSLTLGDISEAVRGAEESVAHADRTGDAFQRMVNSTRLADALHQAGRADDAQTLFAEAEQMQAEQQPEYPLLYSLQGFQWCDLLLARWEQRAWQARCLDASLPDGADPTTTLDEIEQRVTQTQQWAIDNRAALLFIALDHLTLARVALYRSRLEQKPLPDPSDPESHIAHAVTGLRKAGDVAFLVRGLLTLAWYCHEHGDEAGARAALDEAEAIAARGPMPLHLADIHLYRARLFGDRAELDKARALIEKHGYNRRLPELHDAEAALPAN